MKLSNYLEQNYAGIKIIPALLTDVCMAHYIKTRKHSVQHMSAFTSQCKKWISSFLQHNQPFLQVSEFWPVWTVGRQRTTKAIRQNLAEQLLQRTQEELNAPPSSIHVLCWLKPSVPGTMLGYFPISAVCSAQPTVMPYSSDHHEDFCIPRPVGEWFVAFSPDRLIHHLLWNTTHPSLSFISYTLTHHENFLLGKSYCVTRPQEYESLLFPSTFIHFFSMYAP